jgi:multicomponent Na+:H+ antiporter subunit B
MLRNSLILGLVAVFALAMFTIFSEYKTPETLNRTAQYYNENEVSQVGAANVVTAVVVTYRGLDTLGEVTVLFLTASVIGFILRRKKKGEPAVKADKGSEILSTASRILFPGSIILGVYVFVNGHLTPGGGFQGGAVIGTAILLIALANPEFAVSRKVLHWLESLSGVTYVIIGLLGIFLAAGFLDNRILPLGDFGHLLSAGAIPIIYSMIGIKVGAELSGIITDINQTKTNLS